VLANPRIFWAILHTTDCRDNEQYWQQGYGFMEKVNLELAFGFLNPESKEGGSIGLNACT
jgi:hypothetical protein